MITDTNHERTKEMNDCKFRCGTTWRTRGNLVAMITAVEEMGPGTDYPVHGYVTDGPTKRRQQWDRRGKALTGSDDPDDLLEQVDARESDVVLIDGKAFRIVREYKLVEVPQGI